jgi:ATP-dependent Clp protease ATP-binding subunit ClpC
VFPPQVIGRSREVSRVTQILARRTKNNPILLGEPGVGKTAIAEGLAASIVLQSNPDGTLLPAFLHNKRVMQLDVGRIISGQGKYAWVMQYRSSMPRVSLSNVT